MSVQFRPAKRERIPLLVGVAGGTGSGKTMSALRLARGIADGKPFAAIDTENGRMNHYADLFPELMIAQITEPFRPQKYTDAIKDADKFLEQQSIPVANRVVVVDSASHEWYGDGGCLDWHDEIMGGDQAKNLLAWVEPKKAHKRMVTGMLQRNAHIILCFRAEPKVEAVKDSQGRTSIAPKKTIAGGGLDGWIPISEKNLPYEMTASFLLMADAPGVPKPIKLQEQHKPFVKLDAPLDEDAGRKLAAWAAGSLSEPEPTGREGSGSMPAASSPTAEAHHPASPEVVSDQRSGEAVTSAEASGSLSDLSDEELEEEIRDFAEHRGTAEKVTTAILDSRVTETHREWLITQRSRAVSLAGGEEKFQAAVAQVRERATA